MEPPRKDRKEKSLKRQILDLADSLEGFARSEEDMAGIRFLAFMYAAGFHGKAQGWTLEEVHDILTNVYKDIDIWYDS